MTTREQIKERARKREEMLMEVPWIGRVPASDARPCGGWKSSKGFGHCKSAAKYTFIHLRVSEGWVRVGEDFPIHQDYCMAHLYATGLYGSMEEEDRFLRFVRYFFPEWITDAPVEEKEGELVDA